MPTPKAHTFYTLFDGSGAPAAPWAVSSAGGIGSPFMQNGVLRFAGVGVGGTASDLDADVLLDWTRSAFFLQFASLLGQAETIEFNLFTTNYVVTMQLAGLFWNLYVIGPGSTIAYSKEHVFAYEVGQFSITLGVLSAASIDGGAVGGRLCWQIDYSPDHTLQFRAGPTPEGLRVIDTTGVDILPFAEAQAVTHINLASKNTSTFTVTYGETQLVGFNAWAPLQAIAVATRPAPPIVTAAGTPLPGTTGIGSLALDPSTIGVLVHITTIPGYSGLQVGDPNVLFDLGWVCFGNGTAYETRQFITHEQWIAAPRLPAVADHLAYSLNPGVVATFIPITTA